MPKFLAPLTGLDLPLAQGRFNVRDFGAVGDGTADDTAAIQAAMDAAVAAGGGIVLVTQGNYRLTAPLTPNGCLLIQGAGVAGDCWNGQGTWLLPDFSVWPGGRVFQNTGIELTVQELGIGPLGGSMSGTYPASGIETIAMGTSRLLRCKLERLPSPWYFSGDRNSLVSGCIIEGCTAVATLDTCTAAVVDGCLFLGSEANPIMALSSSGVEKVSARITNCVSQGAASGAVGVDVYVSDGTVTDFLVDDCDFSDCSGGGVVISHGSLATSRINNVIGYNPVGKLTAQPDVSASGTAFVNPFGVDCEVYVAGGTVTVVAIGGEDTGTAGAAGSYSVPAGQSITLTYSEAPTWVWFGN